jgi:hypothetical protein
MAMFKKELKEYKKPDDPLHKTPKSLQELIEIERIAENGIFQLSPTRFSKTYRFRDINYSTLDTGNQALCSMMFSDYQLNTKMDIGFVGSSNIGSVALNQFKDSE